MKRKICVVTGTRAEYGILYWIIKGIHEDPDLELQLVVTGMHLSAEFGLTVKVIEGDGFPISERVEMLLSADTEAAVASSMGIGMIGFAKVYERLKPDLITVLGDRFEIFAAVAAAVPFRIPIAHIHGGEATQGAMDECFRHAITKMSHLHFPAAGVYAKRIMQMGENPENVFCFGAPGLDNIRKLKLLERDELFSELQLPEDKTIGVVTFHPVTLEKDAAEMQMTALLGALRNFEDIYWVFTMPNADTGGRAIAWMMNNFVKDSPASGKVFASLGQVRYLSLLKHAALMVGNSSSGIIEAPSFGLPVVNIGDRQRGRMRAANVIDIEDCRSDFIVAAIRRAVSLDFRNLLKGIVNPYGAGDASDSIVSKIKSVGLDSGLIKKSFQEAV
ncbi:MAG: UDP-N-acetylglucosamine 2-epimerase (hydrolyzing) [Nitrospirae bacterium]|nr:MAG: UDP-N-acetylglucosamine 2-epimerase (hydrolyzing) [Nitrospirota bacterium]